MDVPFPEHGMGFSHRFVLSNNVIKDALGASPRILDVLG